MTRPLLALDRVVVLLLGVALVVLGLLALDWRWQVALSGYDDRLGTSAARDVVDSGWWPWVSAVVGVVLGLAGLWWLLAHTRRPGSSALRLSASGQTGRVEADLRSVAAAVAARLERTAPVVGAKGDALVGSGASVVEITAHVDPYADAASLIEAVESASREVVEAFPDDRVQCRVVLSSPRRARRVRGGSIRVTG